MPSGVYKRTKKHLKRAGQGIKKGWAKQSSEKKAEISAKRSERMKKLHQDPEYRAKMQKIYAKRATNGFRERLSAGMSRHYSTIKALKKLSKDTRHTNRDYANDARKSTYCVDKNSTQLRKRESSYGVVVDNAK